MANIPLEDTFSDVINKAQRGLKLSDEELAGRAGIALTELRALKTGVFEASRVRKVAPVLNLAAGALGALGEGKYLPLSQNLEGVASFNTPYEDMTVNSYLVFDPRTREAAAFDTGASCEEMLRFARQNHLVIKFILLTHTHVDHVMDLDRLKRESGAPVFVGELEQFPAAQAFAAGKAFAVGDLKIQTRQTSGHARGGITFVIHGLGRTVAVVGDALFAGSMGGGAISYEEALRTNRAEIFSLPDDTLVCPGHGPLTAVGEEKLHNPFYPEFK